VSGLVDVQGESIDHIEQDMLQSSSYVQSAKTDTITAVKYQSKARRVSLYTTSLCALFKKSVSTVYICT